MRIIHGNKSLEWEADYDLFVITMTRYFTIGKDKFELELDPVEGEKLYQALGKWLKGTKREHDDALQDKNE
jgi:hypothetical protein